MRHALLALLALVACTTPARAGVDAFLPAPILEYALTPAPIRLVVYADREFPQVIAAYHADPRSMAFTSTRTITIYARASDWRVTLAHEMSHALELVTTGRVDQTLDAECVTHPDAYARAHGTSYACQRTEENARAYAAAFYARCPPTALGAFGVPGDPTCTPPHP